LPKQLSIKKQNDFLLIGKNHDYSFPDRVVLFQKEITKPKENVYYVRFRGIPVENAFEFLESIELAIY
jgi:hypothetical protein